MVAKEEKSLEKVVIWKTIIFEKESEEEKMLKKEYLLRGKDLRNSSYKEIYKAWEKRKSAWNSWKYNETTETILTKIKHYIQ